MQGPHTILTNVGRVRDRNEDLAVANSKRGVFVLADGMGGHPDGNLAARIAVDTAMHYLTAKSVPGRPRGRGEKLTKAICAANDAILARSNSEDGQPGMGTTLVCAWVGKRHVHIAHVGDSRAYRVRDGEIERLTRDHTVVQALLDRGDLDADSPEAAQLGHILTQAVGLDPAVEPEVTCHPARRGDIYLLCSDGLSDLVPDSAIGTILNTVGSDLDAAAASLIDTALEAGGHDNVTVVLACDDEPRSAKPKAAEASSRTA